MGFSATNLAVPERFICPITQEIMVDPLVSKHGHNFERRAILQWLNDHANSPDQCCPMTRKALTPSMLFPNASLRTQIRSWQAQNGLPITCRETTEKSTLILASVSSLMRGVE
uniref:U-box domain-containing protein n=1 Tax=Craspedostauros australis TaxID=1486917 RepID=A0A7R9WYF8_9STRA|mmetsp:Transcript_23792/g.66456  ORF Transcript_23792/g.66456 Transcript_23792/m.66456 type:complete len:113 (+) Transcript_23792:434-772(+)